MRRTLAEAKGVQGEPSGLKPKPIAVSSGISEAMPFPSLPSLYTKSRGTVAVSNHRLPVILSPVILSEVEETAVWPTRAEKQVSRLRRSSALAGDPAALEMTTGN